MKIVMHDFGGYPFPVELSRELANRGHEVFHLVCGSLTTTPRSVESLANDPDNLKIIEIKLKQNLQKYSFAKRWMQERAYGDLVATAVAGIKPDIVVSANTPLDSLNRLSAACKRLSIPFVFWLQDVISVATKQVLSKKLPIVGQLIGSHYARMERRLLHQSDRILLITEDFRPIMSKWGIDSSKCHVLENWAPIEKLPQLSKVNSWSERENLSNRQCVVYTGTLGMKHNPELILQLALSLQDQPSACVVVVSQGLGADYLKQKVIELRLTNLITKDFTPFEVVPQVMAAADVLITILEKDAGVFSVPSKVLAYHCAGRPIVAAVPKENLVARVITQHQSGLIVEPENVNGFVQSVRQLLSDSGLRSQMGGNARKYAEDNFHIEAICDRFLAAIGHKS